MGQFLEGTIPTHFLQCLVLSQFEAGKFVMGDILLLLLLLLYFTHTFVARLPIITVIFENWLISNLFNLIVMHAIVVTIERADTGYFWQVLIPKSHLSAIVFLVILKVVSK